MITNATIRERVRAGARLLDERKPGWPAKVDVETLDMMSGRRDLLGQLYGGFIQGLGSLRLYDLDLAAQHGFCRSRKEIVADVADEGKERFYVALRRAWIDEIAGRRETTTTGQTAAAPAPAPAMA